MLAALLLHVELVVAAGHPALQLGGAVVVPVVLLQLRPVVEVGLPVDAFNVALECVPLRGPSCFSLMW